MTASVEMSPPKVDEIPRSENLRDKLPGETHKLPNLSRIRMLKDLEAPAVAMSGFSKTVVLLSASAGATGTERVEAMDPSMTDSR
jgi:hypothetical protein